MHRFVTAYGVWVLLTGMLLAPWATAQRTSPLPSQQHASVQALGDVPVERLGGVNEDSLRADDEEQRGEIGPYRYGEVLRTDITPKQAGTWEQLPTGDRLWRLRIQSRGARSLSLGFPTFELPRGARLFVHGGAGKTVRGPYVRADATNGQHWTPLVRSSEIVVELAVPEGRRSEVDLVLGKVVHGYRPLHPSERDGAGSKAGSCNLDVACEEADPWRDQVRSVGSYSFEDGGSSFVCTGSLVNNTAGDQRPFFLTAEHCVSSASTAPTMVFYWNYQNETCRTPGTGENGDVTDDNKLDQTSSGALLRARYGGTHDSGSISGKSDLALVEVDDDIPKRYDLFFSGWSREGSATEEGVTVHHPAGHGKRISFDRDPSTITGYLEDQGGDTHLRIGNWETGTTEGGSSGAPLYDTNQRIVGVLSGGFASCVSGSAEDNNEPDWYGRIAPGFESGDYQGNTLADWLDPTGSGTLVLDGQPQRSLPRPDPPTGVTTTAGPDSVTLDWTASDSTDVVQYRVYRATAPIDSAAGPPASPAYDSVSAERTRYADTRVTLSTTYHYRLTAVDDSSFESSPSEQSVALAGQHPVLAIQPDSIAGRTGRGTTAEQEATITNDGPSNSLLSFSVDGFAAKALLARVPDHEHNPSTQAHGSHDLSKGAPDPRTGAPVTLGAGGPDDFGYRWIDSTEPGGPPFRWTDIRSTGTQVPLGDDDSTTVETPEGFSFYGTERSTVTISSNGYLTFGDNATAYRNSETPDAAPPNALIAPFWDDLSPPTNGTVHYLRDTEGGRLVVQWTDVPYFRSESQNTFQVILEDSGTIQYRYLEMAPRQQATVGIENDEGTDGLSVAFNTEYVTDSLAVRIATTPPLVADVSPASGELSSGASKDLTVTLDANRPAGTYSRRLPISTNDPEAESVDLPFGLTVESGPPAPANLTATTTTDSVMLNWTAPTGADVAAYRIYRTTTPTDFQEGPAALSPTDSVAGASTRYTEAPDSGRTYYYRVTAATNGSESALSDEARAFLYPTQVRASVSRAFGDASEPVDYRLVALPGKVGQSLASAVEGEAGTDWQAYWDDGSASDFFVKHNESGRFTFEPGAGFWLTATSDWTRQTEVPTVELRGDSAATIGLREDWNIVSNPTGKDVAWNRVEGATSGSLRPLWAFDGAFAEADTFRSAREGVAYYLFNDRADRDSLVIPYPGAPGTSTAASKRAAATSPLLAVEAQPADAAQAPTTTVRMGIADDASSGLGPEDLIAPPGRFAETSLRIEAPDEDASARTRTLMVEQRPPAGANGGHTFALRLVSPAGEAVNLTARHLEAVRGREVRLLQPAAGTTHDLREQSRVTIEPDETTTPLRVAVGTADYVERQADDVLPTEVRLTAYPNPVRRQGTVAYALPEPQRVTLRIYDVLGRKVATLERGRKEAGRHTVRLDGRRLSSGLYVGRLTTGGQTRTQKITVVR